MNRDGINQTQLSKAIGVKHPSVSGWVSGAKPRKLVLARLADFFGVPVDILEDDQKPLGQYQFPLAFRHGVVKIKETVDQAYLAEGKPKEAVWDEINEKLTALLDAVNRGDYGQKKH
jgi:transcriptional regulator with XRE-family HTH domain